MNAQIFTISPRRTRGRPRADPQDDQWFGIDDARERKRRQDRLAQRARSKHGRDVRPKAWARLIVARREAQVRREVGLLHRGQQLPNQTTSYGAITFEPSTEEIAPDYLLLTLAAPLLYAALVGHGDILGLKRAECHQLVKSLRANAEVPASLQPTPLQLTTPHLPWIDRFPFPRMRDNMIILRDVINLDPFCGELFSGNSFYLEHGKPSWDPKNWRIDSEFSTKWGFLLY
ncbi:hypothetical protein PRZ48_007434 [Zasmidium cellare]|uniref:Uncharacterized protein n=1 Tax=Zasmidium cellare TaxID=395010 RepID=A0ABR0EK40_ZASCE|nr:hypothetical protein PRZ48_007434 [Zasmidium cellare]